jgi:hypothetical protein
MPARAGWGAAASAPWLGWGGRPTEGLTPRRKGAKKAAVHPLAAWRASIAVFPFGREPLMGR